jgi:LysR family nitrogen assimilation transcriptional regulator
VSTEPDNEIIPPPKLGASNLDIRPIYYFVHVVTSGSFSRAAASLSIAQPVLSKFIKRLEENLQTRLLYRNGRGVGLTEAGQAFFRRARTVLDELSQGNIEVAAMRGVAAGRVAIALPPLLGSVLTTELIQRLKMEHPLVTLSLKEGFLTESLEWLSSGQVDVAVVFNPPSSATLITEHVCDDRIHLVGAPNSLDIDSGDGFDASRLGDICMVLPPEPHRLRALLEEAAHKARVELNVEVEVTGTITALELVRSGIGFSILPSLLLKGETAEGRIQSWPIENPSIISHLYTATSMQRPQTTGTRAVLKLIRDIFEKVSGPSLA